MTAFLLGLAAQAAYAEPYKNIGDMFLDIIKTPTGGSPSESVISRMKDGIDFNAGINDVTELQDGYYVHFVGDKPVPKRSDAGLFCFVSKDDQKSVQFLKSLKAMFNVGHFYGPVVSYRPADLYQAGDGRAFFILVKPCSISPIPEQIN